MGGMTSNISSAVSNATPSSAPSNGGKSAPPAQNSYSPSFGGPSAAPTSAAPPSGGGKSSGLGQGGYGGAPAFQQPIRQDMSTFAQSPFPPTPLNSSINTTTTADMMGGNRNRSGQDFGQVMQGLGMPMQGGKSSGLGQGGYGGAPGFGGGMNQMGGMDQMGNMRGMGALGGFGGQMGMGGGFQQPQFNPFQQQMMQQQPQRQSRYYEQQQPQFNPFQQQQQFQQPQISGLQGLFNQMMGQFQQQQRPQQMPRFQSQALQYRPNMQNAQAALSRVKPSVQGQQQDAQAARIAELEAQIAAFQPQTPTDYGNSGG